MCYQKVKLSQSRGAFSNHLSLRKRGRREIVEAIQIVAHIMIYIVSWFFLKTKTVANIIIALNTSKRAKNIRFMLFMFLSINSLISYKNILNVKK